ncbi:MAG: lytic transglycosylase domain-containing protein [Oscillospiraceae bacterium]
MTQHSHRIRSVVVRLGLVVLLLVLALRVCVGIVYPVRYEALIERYSRQNGVPTALVYGVIRTESGFRADAVSPIGARGLMQITKDTFEWAKWRMGDERSVYEDLFDAETNIRYGTYILRLLIDEFEQTDTALAAYHAGWGSVKGWLSKAEHSSDGKTLISIPFANTARYVPRVLHAEAVYHTLYKK